MYITCMLRFQKIRREAAREQKVGAILKDIRSPFLLHWASAAKQAGKRKEEVLIAFGSRSLAERALASSALLVQMSCNTVDRGA